MKYLNTALLGLGMLASVSGAALAADIDVPTESYQDLGWYLRADAGYSWIHSGGDDDSGLAVGGGIGMQYSDTLRGDVRVDWAGMGNDQELTTVLGNLYFDIPTETIFTPYLGAGAGYGWASNDNRRNGADDGFAFALMAGAEFGLTDSLSADLGYRYRQVISGRDPSDHQVLLGLRYKF